MRMDMLRCTCSCKGTGYANPSPVSQNRQGGKALSMTCFQCFHGSSEGRAKAAGTHVAHTYAKTRSSVNTSASRIEIHTWSHTSTHVFGSEGQLLNAIALPLIVPVCRSQSPSLRPMAKPWL
eukprot:scaffold303587_cov17-Tisochrysis_lutea.AAC.1